MKSFERFRQYLTKSFFRRSTFAAGYIALTCFLLPTPQSLASGPASAPATNTKRAVLGAQARKQAEANLKIVEQNIEDTTYNIETAKQNLETLDGDSQRLLEMRAKYTDLRRKFAELHDELSTKHRDNAAALAKLETFEKKKSSELKRSPSQEGDEELAKASTEIEARKRWATEHAASFEESKKNLLEIDRSRSKLEQRLGPIEADKKLWSDRLKKAEAALADFKTRKTALTQSLTER